MVTLAGVASAAQGTVNAELGERAGNATLGAVVNNLGGALLVGLGALALPSARAGLVALRRARLPWWAYLGGLGGAAIVLLGAYIVPVLGVAVFTIAQVAGGSLGGLAVDRAGLAPVGRLALTRARVAGALLGVADAIALARSQGVDPQVMREVLLGGSARSFVLEKHSQRVIDADFKPGFRARLMRKDLRIALATAQAGGAALQGAPVAEALVGELCDSGRAETDWAAIGQLVQDKGRG